MTSKSMATVLATLVVLVATLSTSAFVEEQLNSGEFLIVNSNEGQNFCSGG